MPSIIVRRFACTQHDRRACGGGVEMGTDMETVEDAVGQMKLLLGAIPPQPSAAAVEEARQAIREEERALTAKLGELFVQSCAPGVPAAAFRALQELHKGVMRTQSEVRRRDDAFVLQLLHSGNSIGLNRDQPVVFTEAIFSFNCDLSLLLRSFAHLSPLGIDVPTHGRSRH